MTLLNLVLKIGLNRKYLMEQLLIEADQEFIFRQYDVEQYWE